VSKPWPPGVSVPWWAEVCIAVIDAGDADAGKHKEALDQASILTGIFCIWKF